MSNPLSSSKSSAINFESGLNKTCYGCCPHEKVPILVRTGSAVRIEVVKIKQIERKKDFI